MCLQTRILCAQYFMGDGSISIYEPPIQNSGFLGGKFLERQRIIRHSSSVGFGDWMTENDLLIEVRFCCLAIYPSLRLSGKL